MKNLFLIVALVFLMSACTTEEPISPSGDNVPEADNSSASESESNNKPDNNNQMTQINQENFEDLASEYNKVLMKTSKGDIEIKLYSEESPVTVNNFLNLAKNNFYDGVKFHRVMENFMIQAGDPLSKDDNMKAAWGTGGPGYKIDDEYVEELSNVRGTIAMANAGPNTGGSQFFINVVNNTGLDWDKEPATSKHPVFGEVVSGMEVADAISKVETAARNMPVEDVVIESIELIEK